MTGRISLCASRLTVGGRFTAVLAMTSLAWLVGCATPEATYQPEPYSTSVWNAPLADFTPALMPNAGEPPLSLQTRRLAIVVDTHPQQNTRDMVIKPNDVAARINATLPADEVLEVQTFSLDLRKLDLKNSLASEYERWRRVMAFIDAGDDSSALVVIGGWSNLPTIPKYDRRNSCTYFIGIGSRFALFRPAGADSCGFVSASNRLMSPDAMAHFVQQLLYQPPRDSDGDGIYDYADQCPETPAGRRIDYSGCLVHGLSVASEENTNEQ